MATSDRWQQGDVLIWFQTGTEHGAKTDSDIYLSFYSREGELIGWVQAYERRDLTGFEEGEINCGYLGNTGRSAWLQLLLDEGNQLGLRIENVSDDSPHWFCESISLDFRVNSQTRTFRRWVVGDWIEPQDAEAVYHCEEPPAALSDVPLDVGFEGEVEIQAGSARETPQD